MSRKGIKYIFSKSIKGGSRQNNMIETKQNKKWLELGDFIQITAPTNPEWHDQLFYISYLDESVIELVDILSNQLHLLQIQKQQFLDRTIEKIVVIDRSPVKGYARQNGLFPHIWVDIFFGGELPKSITAEIRHLEEDMIELHTYPENKILFLDFAYQGVPRNIPLERICIREKPASYVRSLEVEGEGEGEGEREEGTMEYTKEGMIDIVLPRNAKPDESYHERLKKLEIRFLTEEELPEIVQTMEVAPELQRYGLEAQINDLLDAFLSTIPDYKRTPVVLQRIYTHIQRFKELREMFSSFDPTFHTILGPKKSNPKPLIRELAELTSRMPWVLPVANQTKKVYFLAEDGPILSILIPEIDQKNMTIDAQNETETENRAFYNNTVPEETIVKYANMHLQTAEYHCPFGSTTLSEEDSNVLAKLQTVQVKRDMDILISTGQENDLFSMYSADERVGRSKFIRNRYNAEITYPYKRNTKSKEASLFAPLFPADSLDFRSVVFLPEPFIAFSKIRTPNTSIYRKSELHLHYPSLSRFLHRKTEIEDREISANEREFGSTSATHIRHYYPSSKSVSLESFLNHCIPETEPLLDTYVNRIFQKKLYSFSQIVDVLEPFYIYMENISWKSANKIKTILYKNIDTWITNTNVKAELFKSWVLEKYKSELMKMANALESLDKRVKEIYADLYESTSSSEFLRTLFDEDQMRLFSCRIKRISTELFVPENMLPSIIDESMDSSTNPGGVECWKRVITKKYTSVADLTADNGNFIHYDKEFDKTEYSLVEKYRQEKPELAEDATAFLNFLAENLIAKHHYHRDRAFQEARNMIAGERPVEEGEYAVLFLLPHLRSDVSKDTLSEKEKDEVREEADTKKRVMYFIRKNNTWVHVVELDELSFIDNFSLFCNLQDTCYSSSSSKSKSNICETPEMTKERMHYLNRERMESEFKDRYEISLEDFSQLLEQEENRCIQQKEQRKKTEYSLVDAVASSLASRAILNELIFSPYLSLRDRILEKSLDFTTKNHYILLFVERFCREALSEEPMKENAHWFYCKETNTMLMPKSLFLLAKAAKEGKYTSVLNQLCNTVGKLSDDGDAYVDKHSGYLLKKIEYREEEGIFSSGEGGEGEDQGEVVEEIGGYPMEFHPRIMKDVSRIFQNEIDQKIYNLISSICRNMYVIGEENKDKMIQLCQKWLKNPKLFISQEKYQKQYDIKIEKRKQDPKLKIPDDFETYNKKQHIMIAALSVLITVQTAVPEMAIKRTFPGCVKSFSGYPLKDGQDDLSSLHYMACVLKKMYIDNKEEKNLLPKKESDLVHLLLNTLKDVVLLQVDIIHLYDVKRNYLRNLVTETKQTEEIEVQNRWAHFLPPISAFTIPSRSLEIVSPSGNRMTHILNVYLVKNMSLTLSLVDYIREIIARKGVLFQTKTGKAYLQNACCEELLRFPSTTVLGYFKEEDAAISKIVDILHNLGNKITAIREKSKAPVLLKTKVGEPGDRNPDQEKAKKSNPIYSYEPAIFYAALIHYGKLGSEIYPIPTDLETICSKKPNDWISSLSMPEKIELLEKQQIRTDARKTITLMNIVHQRHPVSIIQSIDFSPKNRVQMAIEDFIDRNADIPIIQKIGEKWLSSISNESGEKIDYEAENKTLQKTWFSFIERNAEKKPKSAILRKLTNVLYSWENYQEIPLSNLFFQMKSIVYRIGILFPSYLVSEKTNAVEIPKHWELIPSDVLLLKKQLQTYKQILNPFKNEEMLVPIFETVVERVQPLMEFIEFSLYMKDTDTNSSEKAKDFFELSLFCIHLVWMIWIGLIDNPAIYRVITNILQKNTENQIEENKLGDILAEEEDEMQEVNITTLQLENKSLIQQRIADVFLAIIETLKSKKQSGAKEPAMMSYADIMREIDYSRDREKQKIKKYFTDMSVEERKAELVLKKLHLGIFAIDTKKLNKYGKTAGLFGDKDQDIAAIAKEGQEDDIEDSVEYQNMIREEEADPERDIYLPGDVEEEFVEPVREAEDDYNDMNEYAYDNYEGTEYD